ncbi:uncharacterized protein PGTG_19370 [Puccinia graminis f. sp. tritici CRL 75-36-700-3]|uniref:Uncharacterized protein n=1 Tax=Puccinia graminis f. sp. tritici (strain CRL 75-36-700-3 / race SCCL) TaxID=418459 RepID=E3L965_PUCGT|nr:uncharacterized protein PGTG_19370 [Puccinia graminis f. sp. tritici CRL 75-36-700-3]EFP93090.2 hypothetical protein PGTG_19370 [Puccinia graminis f. sp. tritici CRL 75-36-700-3]
MPCEKIVETTIRDGEDLGFGSDSSDIEEAPSDYSEEFCTWEVFGDTDILEATAAVAEAPRTARNDWVPFTSQEDFMACLMSGYLRKMLSRVTYLLLRLILAMKNLILPHWDSVRRTKERIRRMLGLTTIETLSVWDNKLFTISLKVILANELLNPQVTRHLEYCPHDPTGTQIGSLYQCFKWREDLSRELRANGSLYAKCCTPQYKDSESGKGFKIVIPGRGIKFSDHSLTTVDIKEFDEMYSELYLDDNTSLDDTCGGRLFELVNGDKVEVALPNPWRQKANGKIICHVLITLYSDNTSGNSSKQWNKHISFYFTLAGLHPHLTNQEYHCHFLGTSNVAGVLELAEPIVEEMNDLATDGHFAYDSHLKQDVLIMSVIMADSPMHAEITSTPPPRKRQQPMSGLSDGMRQLRMFILHRHP